MTPEQALVQRFLQERCLKYLEEPDAVALVASVRAPLLAEIARLKARPRTSRPGPFPSLDGPAIRADIARRTLPPPRPTGPQGTQ